ADAVPEARASAARATCRCMGSIVVARASPRLGNGMNIHSAPGRRSDVLDRAVRSWRRGLLIAIPFVGLGALSGTVPVPTARGSGELRASLASQFRARPDCPLDYPFVETNVEYNCYDGSLASGRPVTLIVGHEVGTRTTEWSYVGAFVDRPPAGFGAAFAARVRARGDWWGRRAGGEPSAHILVPPPETQPVRAEAAATGFLVAWR